LSQLTLRFNLPCALEISESEKFRVSSPQAQRKVFELDYVCIQQVRSRYWPTLGLSDAKRSQSDTSLQSAERRMGLFRNASADDRGKELSNCSKETSTSTSSHRKSTDSSPINYADIGGFSDGSSSPEKTSPSATTVVHECKYLPYAVSRSNLTYPITAAIN